MNVRTLLNNFLSSGFFEQENVLLLHQVYLLNFFSVLVTATLFVFGFINFSVYGNSLLGWVELTIGVLVLVNILLLRKFHQIHFSKHIFILLGLNALFMLLLTGGIENTGIVWFYVFPVAAMFLVGLRQGILWLAVLSVAIAVVFALERLYFIDLPYSFIFVRQMFFSLLFVSFVSGFANYAYRQDTKARRIWAK